MLVSSIGTWRYITLQGIREKSALEERIAELESNNDELEGRITADSTDSTITETARSTSADEDAVKWKVYTSQRYGVSFKYPSSWPEATGRYYEGEPNTPSPVSAETVTFGEQWNGKYTIRYVALSKYSDYTVDALKNMPSQLKQVYDSQNVGSIVPVIYPPANAATMAATRATYIETEDDRFRGYYYFASMGQDYGPYIDCIVVLTDGKDKIVTFHIAQYSDKKAQYDNGMDGGSPYYDYVKTLTAESKNETAITEFNDIFKPMALSLKSI
ncbi:MAG: hypothetical protein BWY68_00744 [bacterium ADurb.Bin400]|nr:MAG: hypothetical protein BWY68_00744 [bacterium ADurb.Bin400]